MKWVTRARVKVDRVACPWLIRRFIDPQAAFLFVPPDQVAEVASREGATPYDVEGADLGHHGEECSFDAFVRRYQLEADPALQRLRLIVRGADTDRPDLAPEAAGLKAVAHGLSALGHSDERLLELQFPIYDALYAHCGGAPPAAGVHASPP
ncbi:MAG TPA: chromate resistance protein ChrB domain-containing protein [Candidatus Eisenbacteria bacterium]|nr:chromate resistance protein ChrB domain-containing protein [Candidatus Eisenbacteria bacterium]